MISKRYDLEAHNTTPSILILHSQLCKVQSVCISFEPQVGLITDRKLVTDARAITNRIENSRIEYSKNVIVNSKKMILSSADKKFRRPNMNASKDPRHCRYQRVLPPHFSIKRCKLVDAKRPKDEIKTGQKDTEEISAYNRVGSNGSGGSYDSSRKQRKNQQIDCKADMPSLELVPYKGGHNQPSKSNATRNILKHHKSLEGTNVDSLIRMGSSGSQGSSMNSVSRSKAVAENLARIRSQPRPQPCPCSPRQDKTNNTSGLVNKKVQSAVDCNSRYYGIRKGKVGEKRLVCDGENHIQSFMLALEKIESSPLLNLKKTGVTWANEQWSQYVTDK